jgi:hypothetical protein
MARGSVRAQVWELVLVWAQERELAWERVRERVLVLERVQELEWGQAKELEPVLVWEQVLVWVSAREPGQGLELERVQGQEEAWVRGRAQALVLVRELGWV